MSTSFTVYIDNVTVSGVSNGGFETGDFTGWYINVCGVGTADVTTQAASSGTYGCVLEMAGGVYDFIQIRTEIPDLSVLSTVQFDFYFNELSLDETGSIGLFSVIEDYVTTDMHPVYSNFYTTSSTPPETWTTGGSSGLSLPANAGCLYIVVYISTSDSSWDLGDPYVKIYIDDIAVTSGGWSGFTNGDFETGDFTGWDDSNATIDTTIVHGGTYSCKIDGFGSIAQNIDLTDVDQLDIYINASSDPEIHIELEKDATTTIHEQELDINTDGWFCYKIDTSGMTDIHAFSLSNENETGIVYIDDITQHESIDVTPQNSNFNSESWFHTVSNLSYSCYSTISTGGSNDSFATKLYVSYKFGDTLKSYAHTYIDLTDMEYITFLYKIPTFDYGYLNMGGAWLKYNLLQGETSYTTTIADADDGVITDWTEYSIDVSDLTGTWKFTIYGETEDPGYTLHPLITAYIDNVTLIPSITYIREVLNLGIPEEYDGYTDIGEYVDDRIINDIPTPTDTGYMTIDSYHTDVGRSIAVKSFPDFTSYGIKIIKHVTNIMHMRMKRTK